MYRKNNFPITSGGGGRARNDQFLDLMREQEYSLQSQMPPTFMIYWCEKNSNSGVEVGEMSANK